MGADLDYRTTWCSSSYYEPVSSYAGVTDIRLGVASYAPTPTPCVYCGTTSRDTGGKCESCGAPVQVSISPSRTWYGQPVRCR